MSEAFHMFRQARDTALANDDESFTFNGRTYHKVHDDSHIIKYRGSNSTYRGVKRSRKKRKSRRGSKRK